MGHISTRIMTNRDDDFYQLVGPYLSRREIVRDVGYPVWDEDEKVWFVTFDDTCVVGFAALKIDGKKASFVSVYVVPSYRGQGIYRALVARRLDYCRENGVKICKTVATRIPCEHLRSVGFVVTSETKNYYRMEMRL